MTENVPQEVSEVKTTTPQIEPTVSQKPAESPPSAPEDKAEDPNWRAFREARKKDRAEKEAAERRAEEKAAEAAALEAAMEAAFGRSASATHASHQESYQEDESEDVRIEKKVQAAIASREAAMERDRMEREQREYPQRLTQSYPDFSQTVSTENLDYLEYHYPEVAAPLRRLPDNFDKWADIYRAVKKFVPNVGAAKKDAARADANMQRPKSMSAVGASQAGESSAASRLTSDRKAQNWERMQRLLKGLT